MLITSVALVLANRLLLGTGLRRRVDGWRRGAGLVLRGENSTFVLSAFGLNIGSDASAERSTAQASIAGRRDFSMMKKNCIARSGGRSRRISPRNLRGRRLRWHFNLR